jgi:hypothetical protein
MKNDKLYVNEDNEIINLSQFKDINYQKVSKILEREKEISLNFLINSL